MVPEFFDHFLSSFILSLLILHAAIIKVCISLFFLCNVFINEQFLILLSYVLEKHPLRG